MNSGRDEEVNIVTRLARSTAQGAVSEVLHTLYFFVEDEEESYLDSDDIDRSFLFTRKISNSGSLNSACELLIVLLCDPLFVYFLGNTHDVPQRHNCCILQKR